MTPAIAEDKSGQRPGALLLGEPLETALQFIAMCDQFMRPIVLETETSFKIVYPDLPVMQEKAFNLACQVAGEYFARNITKRDDCERGAE